jgi:tetratricopeptide (TPR) repeat protein
MKCRRQTRITAVRKLRTRSVGRTSDMNISRTATEPFAVAKHAIAVGDWAGSITAFSLAVETGAQPGASARLLHTIARIRSGDEAAGIAALDVGLVREADGRADLRRHVVAALVSSGSLTAAAAVLNVLAEAYPTRTDDRRLLASLLGRMKRWDEAILHADKASQIAPGDMSLQGTRIQLRLQAGQTVAAANIARSLASVEALSSHEKHVWMTALMRDGDSAAAARIAAALDPSSFSDERVAGTAVHALRADGRVAEAIATGQAALRAGHDGAALRSQLAQAHLTRGTREDRTVAAMEHLAAGIAFAPNDVRLNSFYGETLLRSGRHEDAIPFLEKCCALVPDLEQTRALYARALRQVGRYSEAADHFMKLVSAAPKRMRWQRHAAAALSQAGRADEASKLFDAFVQERTKVLPATLEIGLAKLSEQVDSAAIPQARLDWAWSLRIGQDDVDRGEWERATRWGHLADHLLLDWLECRDERAEEAMALLADLDQAENFLTPLRAEDRGMVVATAHVGPMYAGPMVLELLGLPSRWLASTPGAARTSYASTLISTSDQTEPQIAKASLRALESGCAVCLAVDGAANPAAPRILFEGQEITYSSFAARAAYRAGVPSIFYAPRWERGRIALTLEMLPSAEPGEDIVTFAARWRRSYLALLRAHLGGAPENLRMSGGLWRHVRRLADSAEPRI